MARQFACVLAAALLSVPAAYPEVHGGQREADNQPAKEQRSQDPNRRKWWINPEHRQELGITETQSAEIDQIFAGKKLERKLPAVSPSSTAPAKAAEKPRSSIFAPPRPVPDKA